MILSNNRIKTFLSFATLLTAGTLFWIGVTPSLTEELFFLSFSLHRFFLFCLVTFLLLFFVISLFLLRNEKFYFLWGLLFRSKWVLLGTISSTIIAGILVIGTPLRIFRENTFLLQRIFPVISLLLLLSLDLLITQYLFSNGLVFIEVKRMFFLVIKKIEKGLNSLYQKCNYYLSTSYGGVVFLILVNVPILFINAIRFDYPLGYSGLYTLMSEELVNNNFKLPNFVPYYGPGGIPFAYPPLGFYIMGFFVGILKVPSMVFLRFMPAFYYMIATLLFFIVIKKLTKSTLAGIITSVIVAYSSVNYEVQSTSGGIVRGLALVFLLLGLFFYFNNSKKLIWKSLLVSVFFALTLLTHLGYGFILALIFIALTFSKPFSIRVWLTLLIIGTFTIVLSAPWWITMISRYGFNVFTNAFSSHGNGYLMQIISGEKPLLPWLKISFGTFNQNALFGGIALIGIFYMFFTGSFGPLFVFFLLMLFSEENGRYLIMLGAAGIGVFIAKINSLRLMSSSKLIPLRRIVLIIFFIVILICPEAEKILELKPQISEEVFTLAEYLQPIKEKDSTYFLLDNIDGQGEEWFPYILSMTPFVGGWGGEWVFLPEEKIFEPRMWECVSAKDYECLIIAFNEKSKKPDYLITFSNNEKLSQLLIANNQYFISYENEKFSLWEKLD